MAEDSHEAACPLCGGCREPQHVSVVRRRNSHVVVFENVPAKVCRKCGHRWFGLQAVRQMEERLTRAVEPTTTIRVPVYALPAP